jgi:putative ABC transport system permease protein
MPKWKDEITKRLAGMKLEPTREAEIIEELSQHLDDRYAELRAGGATDDEADRIVLAELSSRHLLAQELGSVVPSINSSPVVLGARSKNMLRDFGQDLRYGVRMMRRNPSFTLIAVMSLTLGIGANTAIFQLLNTVLLRSLPVANPQELAEIRITDMTGARGSFSSPYPAVTNPLWERIRDQQQAFSDLFAWSSDNFNISPSGEARVARGLWVSGNFFTVLGVQPALGRVFIAADDQRGCGTAGVVISHSFWQREFGGDPAVIGRTLTFDGQSLEIIGVTPASFFGLEIGQSFDVAVPICAESMIRGKNNRLDAGTSWWLTVMGRLKPGQTVAEATNHLDSISPGLFEATLPANYPAVNVPNYLGFKLAAYPAGTGISQLRDKYSAPLWLLLALAGLVLLIACANLANLLLARASVRERELAVRLALGASRSRLIRQLMAESILLAALGAGLGLFLARELSQFLVSLLSTDGNPLFLNLNSDWRVLAFTLGLATATCMLFGLIPALRATRTDPAAVMKASGRGLTTSRERFGMRRVLVALQVALSLVLLVGALLFSGSLRNLLTLDAGFQQDGILITSVGLSRLNLPVERRAAVKQEIVERLQAIPGVYAAAETSVVPLSGSATSNGVWMDGADPEQKTDTLFSRVGPGYFRMLDTPLLAGREFDARDTATSPKVAIVNETFARQLTNGANLIGERFRIEATPYDPETVYEIVGLVKDTKYLSLQETFSPIAFLPISQSPRPSPSGQILIRSNTPLPGLIASVKSTLMEINPDIRFRFQVFKTQIRDSLLRERLMATLSGFFGFLAALLASIGLYGVISYMVGRRTHEIGIRMALGASRRNVLMIVMREAAILLVAGLAIGTVLALVVTRTAGALLFGLQPNDPATFVIAVTLLAVIAALASYVPARRAARLDPMVALRDE